MKDQHKMHSRVHPLKSTPNCYIKREDELGCIISGSKARKYLSLVPALKNAGYKRVGLIGSQASNHVLGLSSLLIENGIEPILFLRSSQVEVGNWVFTQTFVPAENIHFLSKADWPRAMEIASTLCPYVIPEGGSIEHSVPGLATLAEDILINEKELKKQFKNILIDSGSGLTAATLIATLKTDATIHVMLAADTEEYFLEVLQKVQNTLKTTHRADFRLHRPPTARAFGSTNSTIFQTIKEVARTEGFLLDPIYSCKLYLLLKELLKEPSLDGPILFIHSGGLFSLSGFQEEFSKESRQKGEKPETFNRFCISGD
ncbi:MAG: pyridoxal-phosphate dependent enzyme [Verrucomicrobia bacterium]|nr:pyridoxal-phosphate dependent enzyme [Verrucomicrobiota bacterium]